MRYDPPDAHCSPVAGPHVEWIVGVTAYPSHLLTAGCQFVSLPTVTLRPPWLLDQLLFDRDHGFAGNVFI